MSTADSAEKKTTAQIDAINEELSKGVRPSASRLAGAPNSGPGSIPPSGIPAPTPSGNLQRALAELQRTSQPPPSVAPIATGHDAPVSRPHSTVPRPGSVAPRPGSVAPRPLIPRPSQLVSEPPPETRRFGETPAEPPSLPAEDVGFVLSSNTEPHGTPAIAPSSSSPGSGPSTLSITSPFGSVMPPASKSKPASLSPIRTPSPMAVVGSSTRSSLRTASPGTAMMPQSAPNVPVASSQPPLAPAAPASSAPRSFGPPSGSMRSAPPAAAHVSTPPRQDSVPPIRPSTQPRSFMPASAISRPPTASKSFSPTAGGPPQQYERAFRQWSSPNITEAEAAPVVGQAPVSFQVYTAKDVANGRGPMRSIAPMDVEPKKSNAALRFGMILLGIIVVALTAAAVIAVSMEDPKKPAPAATVPPPPPAPAPSPVIEASKPTVITVGEDVPPAPSVTAVPTSTGAPVSPAVKRSILRPPPRNPAAPSPIAPPPNPYGK